MAYAAKLKILHRDLRASNILIDENYQARVADWGLACKRTSVNCFPPSLEVVGSLHWMAPEVFKKMCRVEKSDVYRFVRNIFFFEFQQLDPILSLLIIVTE